MSNILFLCMTVNRKKSMKIKNLKPLNICENTFDYFLCLWIHDCPPPHQML